jgi:hypothetical protein
MSPRIEEELGMLKACWPSLQFSEAGLWVLLPGQPLPDGHWDNTGAVDVAIQIPPQLPGQAPYGFYVRPGLAGAGGQNPTNYTFPSDEPPFGQGPWGKFSWSPVSWQPREPAAAGDNIVIFAHSVATRLGEGA